MRRKASPKKVAFRDTRGIDNKAPKATLKSPKTPIGRGLEKAGAKRLGRILKRAIQFLEEEPAVKGKVTLPKTPVRLFKHQIQKEVENAPNQKASKPASAYVSWLIVSLVSQCKHRGGITMADLKKTLATKRYNVTRKQVNVVTKRLINNKTLVPTTRNASFRLHKKNPKQNETSQSWKSNVIHRKPKESLKLNRRTSKSSKGVKKLQRPTRKIPKDRGKSYKTKGKTKKKTSKSTAKSRTRRRKSTRARKKMLQQAGRKHRIKPKQAAQVRKAPKMIKGARRRHPRQNHYPSKSSPRSRKPQRTSVRKTATEKKEVRRRAYYNYGD